MATLQEDVPGHCHLEEQFLDTLRERGGTTIVGGLGLFAVFLVALIAAGLVTDAVVGRS